MCGQTRVPRHWTGLAAREQRVRGGGAPLLLAYDALRDMLRGAVGRCGMKARFVVVETRDHTNFSLSTFTVINPAYCNVEYLSDLL